MTKRISIDQSAAEVVDLFCGVGALSHGLKKAGLKIVAGYDIDAKCKFAYEQNNDAEFVHADVANLNPKEVAAKFSGNLPKVIAGCAPCQPFSTYKRRYDEDPHWHLVTSFGELAVAISPDFITMENVPALVKYRNGDVFNSFCQILTSAGYTVQWAIERAEEYGVPQRRRRLVLLASKAARMKPLTPNAGASMSVRDAIAHLPDLAAGETDPKDAMHAASSLSDLNIRRIKASKPGGTWRDWPNELRAACHTRKSGSTYPSVYARMHWDEPSPTMTTQCYGFGNGRFGHPEQDRAISLREAAILQSFPNDYKFFPDGQKPAFKDVGRWIGNAVPVKLAEAVGNSIIDTIKSGYYGASSKE